MDFRTINGDLVSLDISVASADPTTNHLYPDLKLTSQSQSTVNGAYWVSGTIQNIGSQTAKNIVVVGTFYNSSGDTVAAGYSQFLNSTVNPQDPTSLAPSGTFNFKVGAFDLDQTQVPSRLKIAGYSLSIQADQPVLTGTAPTITPYPSSPDTSSVTNPTDSNSNLIYAIVIAAVVIAVAATILMLKKRKSQMSEDSRIQPSKKSRKDRK
jgi:multisubunit Na+/H+ antiporter MnhC subunit